MRAIRISRFGGPEVLELAAVPVPPVKPGHVLVKMDFAGVNFTDIYRRSGHYAQSPTYPTPLPYVLGVEGAGTVAQTGDGVAGYAQGDRVCFTRNPGSYAEFTLVPSDRLARIPAGVGVDTAASVMTHGMTAHYLTTEFGLKAGDTCLVHAGAGGVGQMLVQLAKRRGATVIATVGSDDKAAIARGRGADHVILYRTTDVPETVRDLTHGRGVDIAFDSVGRDTLHGSLYSLRRHGLCVLYGHASGIVDDFNTMELAEAGSVFLTRPHMEHYVATPAEYARRANDILEWVERGTLDARIQAVYPLAQAAEAHRVLAGRGTRGKLLLRMAD